MVATGRNMSVDAVEAIAQGRIWTGVKAKEIGLVDEIGGIDEAMKGAMEMAGLKSYTVVEYPEQKSSILDEVILSLTEETKAQMQAEQLGILYPHYLAIKDLMGRPVMQARLPYEIMIR